MISCKLEVEDVACPVDDMKKSDCSRSFVQRGWAEGRENKASGSELMDYLGEGPRCRRRKADGARLSKRCKTLMQVTCDVGLVMEELRHDWAQALRLRTHLSTVHIIGYLRYCTLFLPTA
jgi:hypothetical protein